METATSKLKLATILLVVALTASSYILMIESAYGLTKPSIPEFTVKLVDRSYDIPTTYLIDPYTGQSFTHLGYHVKNKTIEITIKNQPYSTEKIRYNVHVKGHFEEDWKSLFNPDTYVSQSDSQFTTIIFSGNEYFYDKYNLREVYVPCGGKIDFQVEAIVGYWSQGPVTPPYQTWEFVSETSGWSNIQTLVNEENAPTPTTTAGAPEILTKGDTQIYVLLGFDWRNIVIVLLVGVVASLVFALAWSRMKKR